MEPLPIDDLVPPSDVSDLRDVVDAINRLCDTMKTSHYDDLDDDSVETGSFVSSDGTVPCDDTDSVTSVPVVPSRIEPPLHESYESPRDDASLYLQTVTSTCRETIREESVLFESSTTREETVFEENLVLQRITQDDVVTLQSEIGSCDIYEERLTEALVYAEVVSPEAAFRPIEINRGSNWSDSLVSLPAETVASDAACEPASEMYYTASSEVSLLSDTEVLADRPAVDDETLEGRESDDRKNVIAGHVAAMRERFESMTRTNTPCPDLARSSSPSLDVFRNITPSPDRLG